MLKWQHGRNRAGLTIWQWLFIWLCHGFFSDPPWHDFYGEHTAKLPHWYEVGYWVWQRGRCFFFFVVGRLLRTIHTAGRISGHGPLLGPANLRPWRPHTVYSVAGFQSSNHIQFITYSIKSHAFAFLLVIYHMSNKAIYSVKFFY